MGKTILSLGFMSGTSLDGVDAALIESDGEIVVKPVRAVFLPYSSAVQDLLKATIEDYQTKGESPLRAQASTVLTRYHLEAANSLIDTTKRMPELVGFHGQTVLHDPLRKISLQLGDPSFLANALGCSVIYNFRQRDVGAGGQGAPLVPIFHQALKGKLSGCCVFVNIGGIANVTWCGDGGRADSLIAFDTGPGNVLLNDWVKAHTGQAFDEGGQIARQGTVHKDVLASYLSHPYFSQPPPKSLDRGSFTLALCQGLSLEDGAATLTALTVRSIAAASPFYPESPTHFYMCGGGRHNTYLVEQLKTLLAPSRVESVEILGWQGDFIEAQAFAYLAIRSSLGKAISFPGTTDVCAPMTGGDQIIPQETICNRRMLVF
ncbi:MAG: anhydro-N-acetylmuramic acid kinase [Alphaproteobacteria bacterium]|nr:anhydro-N-acetylmuramic acid kinase [Alphaproteobacteria bacterium]